MPGAPLLNIFFHAYKPYDLKRTCAFSVVVAGQVIVKGRVVNAPGGIFQINFTTTETLGDTNQEEAEALESVLSDLEAELRELVDLELGAVTLLPGVAPG